MCDCQEPKAAAALASKPVDLTKPVQTRGGKPVRILCTDRKDRNLPVVALVMFPDGREDVIAFTSSGRYVDDRETPMDLVNVPPKAVGEAYHNIYSGGAVGAKFTTKAAAQREALPGAIGLIKLTTYDDGSFTVEKVEV